MLKRHGVEIESENENSPGLEPIRQIKTYRTVPEMDLIFNCLSYYELKLDHQISPSIMYEHPISNKIKRNW